MKSQLVHEENLKKKLSFLWIEKLIQFELIKCPGKTLSYLYRPNFAMSAVIKITESCQKTISVHFGTFTIKISGHSIAGQLPLCGQVRALPWVVLLLGCQANLPSA